MQKITMRPGDTVAIIERGEIKKGILKDVKLLDRPIAIVDFDGDIRKVLLEDLAKVQEDKEKIQEDKEYNVEDDIWKKSEITITPEEFRKIGSKIIAEEADNFGPGGGVIGLTSTIFLAKLYNALFIDEVE